MRDLQFLLKTALIPNPNLNPNPNPNPNLNPNLNPNNIFIPYTHKESIYNILCVKEQRKTDAAGVVSFKGKSFKVIDEGYPLIPAKATVEVLSGIHIGVKVSYKGRVYETEITEKLDRKSTLTKPKPLKKNIAQYVKPHLVHSGDEWKKIWHYESYDDTLAFLYEIFFKQCA